MLLRIIALPIAIRKLSKIIEYLSKFMIFEFDEI